MTKRRDKAIIRSFDNLKRPVVFLFLSSPYAFHSPGRSALPSGGNMKLREPRFNYDDRVDRTAKGFSGAGEI